MEIYFTSVGRNAVLLLNVPPDKRGLIAAEDSARLMEWRAELDKIFSRNLCEEATARADSRWGKQYDIAGALDDDEATCWVAKKGSKGGVVTLTLPEPRRVNLLMLQEEMGLGQRVAEFTIEAEDDEGNWHEIAHETTIGYKRIVPVPDTKSRRIKIRITRSLAEPTLKQVGLFYSDQ